MITQKAKYHIKAKHSMNAEEQLVDKEIRKEGLHIKHEWQIAAMLTSHALKLTVIDKQLSDLQEYPQWRIKKLVDSGMSKLDAEVDLQKDVIFYQKMVGKLSKVVYLLNEDLQFRLSEKVDRSPIGTTYYIDPTNGLDSADGLSTTGDATNGPWKTIEQFAENARAAGDIVKIRRLATEMRRDAGDWIFTSDGDIDNPIVIEADYDDDWTDFANSAQTYTPVFGSKTMTASATITGISVGDWVYNTTDGDDNREFSYEVAAVSGTTLTLYLPWKGSTGSTKTLKVMGASPFWGTTATTYTMQTSNANYWVFQGFHVLSTNGSYTVRFATNRGLVFKDFVAEGNGNGDNGFLCTTSMANVIFRKLRTYNFDSVIQDTSAGETFSCKIYNSLIDCNSVAGSIAINYGGTTSYGECVIVDTELKNAVVGIQALNSVYNSSVKGRNVLFTNCTTDVKAGHIAATSALASDFILLEDYNGTIGDTRVKTALDLWTNTTFYLASDTGTVRSGGSNTSLKYTPTSTLKAGTASEMSRLKLLEIPIYATTASKTYDIYFRPTALADWITDPTAAELWIELEAWGHASNNYRKITKSTGVVDMNGSLTWQALSVTVAPGQAGVAYLRVYYAKPLEDVDSFYIDPLPVIT